MQRHIKSILEHIRQRHSNSFFVDLFLCLADKDGYKPTILPVIPAGVPENAQPVIPNEIIAPIEPYSPSPYAPLRPLYTEKKVIEEYVPVEQVNPSTIRPNTPYQIPPPYDYGRPDSQAFASTTVAPIESASTAQSQYAVQPLYPPFRPSQQYGGPPPYANPLPSYGRNDWSSGRYDPNYPPNRPLLVTPRPYAQSQPLNVLPLHQFSHPQPLLHQTNQAAYFPNSSPFTNIQSPHLLNPQAPQGPWASYYRQYGGQFQSQPPQVPPYPGNFNGNVYPYAYTRRETILKCDDGPNHSVAPLH